MPDINSIIDYLGKQMRYGYDPKVLSGMIGSMKANLAQTTEGLGQSAEQRFQRFGSPVIDAYRAKLDRSRQQAVGRNITSINMEKEARKTEAASMLPQALMAKEQLDRSGFDQFLQAFLGLGNLGLGIFDILNPVQGITPELLEKIYGGRGAMPQSLGAL